MLTTTAWLEHPDGTQTFLEGQCRLGRGARNTIDISVPTVSRRHAVVMQQEDQGHGEFWIVDYGSRNGTLLNNRRLVRPTRLRNGDRIQIEHVQYIYREERLTSADSGEFEVERPTLMRIQSDRRWLLVADLLNSGDLLNNHTNSEAAGIVGTWLMDAQQLVEQLGGEINKFHGDGFLACWRRDAITDEQMAKGLEQWRAKQRVAVQPFRVVLHFGEVAVGGGPSLGEDSLLGKDLHLAYRAEKVGARAEVPCLVTEVAQERLNKYLKFTQIPGKHELKGFEDMALRFFSLE